MKTTNIPMKRHPMTAIAFALATMIAAGCSSSDRDDGARFSGNSFDRRAPAAESFSPVADRDPRQAGAPVQPQSQPQSQPRSQQLTSLMHWERRDMGVPPARELHDGQMHGPTPNQIPGGQVITTLGVKSLLEQQVGARMIDVLGADVALPDAVPAVFAAAHGSFEDGTQQQLARMLSSVTGNDPRVPLVFYCGGPECWNSYNAALRAIALGYRNVLWYRGGLQAWNQAGLPFARGPGNGRQGGNSGNSLNAGYDRG